MDYTTTRQVDVDRRLRDKVGLGLAEWLGSQRSAQPKPASYGVISRRLFELTGDSVSYESLRQWARQFGVDQRSAA